MGRRAGFTLIELLVVVAITSVLVGLLMSAVQKARAASARAGCQDNLRQVALALHQHHDTHRALPPGHRSILNRDLMPFTGWTLSALPYLEQQPLYDQSRAAFRQSLYPFVNPPHVGLATPVPVLTCPSDHRVRLPQTTTYTNIRVAFTSYLGVAGTDYSTRDGLLYQDSRHALTDATDGTSQTLLVGERPPSADFEFGWWYAGIGQRLTGSADLILGVREQNLQPVIGGSACGPGGYRFTPATGFDDPCGMFHFWSPHAGGANFAYADGSVRLLWYDADAVIVALATRAGREVAAAD